MTPQDKLNRLALVANSLRTAAKALGEMADDKTNGYYLCADAASLRENVQEIISCDGGMTGLDALIRRVKSAIDHGVR